jgi:RNA polymerase sigma factor (sigma-70 family)
LTDSLLIQGCAANERNAQFAFYHKYFPFLSGICLRYVFQKEVTREITNDVFMKIFKHIGEFDPEKGQLLSWMKVIAVHTCIDYLKLKSSKEILLNIERLPEGSTDAIPAHELITNDVLKYLQVLPKKQAVVFNLYVVEGYSHEEIGSILNISAGNSR